MDHPISMLRFVIDRIKSGAFRDEPPRGVDIRNLLVSGTPPDKEHPAVTFVVKRIMSTIYMRIETFAALVEINQELARGVDSIVWDFESVKPQSKRQAVQWYEAVFGGDNMGRTIGSIGLALVANAKKNYIVPPPELVNTILQNEYTCLSQYLPSEK